MMLQVVVILLAAALIVPTVHRHTASITGWLLGILTAGMAIVLGVSAMDDGKLLILQENYAWVPSLGANLSLRLDGLSLLFTLLILGIGSLILIYAGSYLHDDRRLGRFYAYLLFFMGSMTGLVLADNLLLLFVFWEMTSVSSFLLIGWDHHRAEARKAALTALLVTAGGGLFMLAGLVLLHQATGQTEISQLTDAITQHSLYLPVLVLIFIGAASKSAQFPLHFWLPGAMAAPTPVSAYLHSATMVKAGIYLMARLHPALGNTLPWYTLLTSFGAVTMLAGALIAITQKDLKRILAYSTVSVLGALMMLLGIGTPEAILAAMVYLLAHSLYKGALFMGAGTLDHETSTRDITELRGLAKLMPISATAAVLAGASSAGFLPLFGFVSKELLYEAVFHAPYWPLILAIVAGVSSVLLVVVGFMVGHRPYFGGPAMAPRMPHEAPPAMWLGAAVLAAMSLLLGVLPLLFANTLGTAAASAVLGEPVTMKLALWHGFTPILAASIITLLLGMALYFLLRPIQNGLSEIAQKFEPIGSQSIYDLAFAGLTRFAQLQTHVVQNGYLRNYVLVIVITMIALVARPISQMFPYLREIDPGILTMTDVVLACVILAGAVAANRIRSRLAIVAILGAIGISVMLLYVMFGAMDLALTQIMVEALTVVLLVLVIYHLPRFVPSSSTGILIRDAIVSLIFGGVMTMLVLMSATLYPTTEMREYFVAHSYTQAHGRNIVNVILVDFRAMDTLGEITVLAVAGIGVFALLKIRVKKEK